MNNNNDIFFDEEVPIKEQIIKEILKNKKRPQKKQKKKKNFILIFLFIVFLTFFTISTLKISFWHKDNKKTNEITEEIETITDIEEVIEEENIELVNEEKEEPQSDYWYYITFPLIQVDFNELTKKNSDTVAWIQVNNTNINYPVVKTTNNDYYLNRSYDKQYNEAGWVFMDYRNTGNLNDKNTIIYAHSRLDKTMFGSLSKVLKSNWYKNKDNHIIKISTPNENSLYQIFSVYKIKAEDYYITTNFNTNNEYLNFLNTIKNRSIYNFNVTLNENDSIITLSTCYSDTERTVVHAKKIKKSTRTS